MGMITSMYIRNFEIPSILLARLASSEHLHGQGLGAELLLRALRTVIDAARVAGGKLVVVDAIDAGAEAFYRHHDFQPLPHRSDRLVMKLSTAAGALDKEEFLQITRDAGFKDLVISAEKPYNLEGNTAFGLASITLTATK